LHLYELLSPYLGEGELPLAEAPRGYEIFQKKEDGAIKAVLKP
jgi:threonine dehydrogenase-like Zn-dependent dehydrogenase